GAAADGPEEGDAEDAAALEHGVGVEQPGRVAGERGRVRFDPGEVGRGEGEVELAAGGGGGARGGRGESPGGGGAPPPLPPPPPTYPPRPAPGQRRRTGAAAGPLSWMPTPLGQPR